MQQNWPKAEVSFGNKKEVFGESGLLRLNCDKAQGLLKWNPALSLPETAEMTASWYRAYYSSGATEALNLSIAQIENYTTRAAEEGIAWASN